jgi:hypothetical protein
VKRYQRKVSHIYFPGRCNLYLEAAPIKFAIRKVSSEKAVPAAHLLLAMGRTDARNP